MKTAQRGLLGVAFVVLGAGASTACYRPVSAYPCELSGLAHPSMDPDDLSNAMDRRVRESSEGAVGLGAPFVGAAR